MQDRHVVLDHGGLADHEAGGVVEENPLPDRRRRVDVGLEHGGRTALQVIGEILSAPAPQPVREAMGFDGVKALEIEHRFEEAVGRRIAVVGRDDVGAECDPDRGLRVKRVVVGLRDQLGRDIGMVETLGQPVHDRGFEPVVMQNGRVDEGRKLGLAAHHLFGLVPDAGPYRIDLLERARDLPLLPSHDILLHHQTARPPSTDAAGS